MKPEVGITCQTDDLITRVESISISFPVLVESIGNLHFVLVGLPLDQSSLTMSLDNVCQELGYKVIRDRVVRIVEVSSRSTGFTWLTLDEVCNTSSNTRDELFTTIALTICPFLYSQSDLAIISNPKCGFVETYENGNIMRSRYGSVLGWKVYRNKPTMTSSRKVLIFNDEDYQFTQGFWFVLKDLDVVLWN